MARQYKTGLIITGDASGGIKAVRATEKELAQLNKGFDRGSKRAKTFADNAGGASRELEVMRRLAAPVGAALAGMFAANSLREQINFADQLQKTNLRIGASTEALSQYAHVANLADVQFNELTTAWQRQSRRVAQAARDTGEAKDALAALNLSAGELAKLAPEDQFEKIASAMNGVASESQRVALAQKIWDSEGVKLLQIVNQGTDAIRAQREEAERLGLTISQDTAEAMAGFNDEVTRMTAVGQGLSRQILADLVPAMTSGMQATSAWIAEMGGAEAALEGLLDIGGALAALYAGRMVGSLAATAAEKYKNVAASRSQMQAEVAATQQAARRAAAEALAEKRLLGRAIAEARATRGTDAHSAALARLGAARQRSVAAATASAAATNAHTAAMGRATVAAGALGAASRGAAGAMALIGGPAGAAILAGAAIYTFRDELGLTVPVLDANSEAVHQLTGKVKDLTRAEAELTLTRLVGQLAEAKAAAEGAGEALQQVGQAETPAGGGGGILGVSGAEITRQTKAIKEISTEGREAAQDVVNLEAAIEAVQGRLTELSEEGEGAAVTTTRIGEAAETAAAAAKREADALESLRRQLDPAYAASQKLASATATLDKGLATGALTLGQYLDLWDRAAETYIGAGDSAEEAAARTVDSVDEMAQIWERSFERLDDAGVDFWRGFLDGTGSTMDQFEDIVLSTVAEVAHQLITRPLVVNMTGQITGVGSGAQGAGGGGGLGSLSNLGSLSQAKSLITGNSIGQGISSAAQGIYGSVTGNAVSYGGSGWAAQTGAGNAGWLGNAGNVSNLAMAGGGFLGGWASGQLFGQSQEQQIGSTIGTIAGSFIPVPVVGPLIGSFLGGALGSVFGSERDLDLAMRRTRSRDEEDWDKGIVAEGALGAVGFRRDGSDQIDKLWDVDEGKRLIAGIAQLDTALASLADNADELEAMRSAVLAPDRHGVQGHYGETSDPGKVVSRLTSRYKSAIDALDSAFESTLLGFDGGAEELVTLAGNLDAVETAIGGNAAAMAEAQRQLSDSGADVLETAQRLAQQAGALAILDDAAGRLNLRFDATSSGALAAADSLAQMAGGTQNLAAVQQGYYQAAFSETERLSHQAQDLATQLAALTDETPSTVEELRHLVEAQDLHSESGAELAYQLMQLTPAFAEITGAVEQALEQAYQTHLGREADADGLAYWMDQVGSGALSLSDALDHIAHSAEAAEYAAGGAGDAIAAMADAIRTRERLERQILQLQGDTQALRQLELDALREIEGAEEQGLVALQERIWSLQAETEAAREAARIEQQIAQERAGLERALLQAQGDTEALRALELAALAPSNRALQERIWALEEAAQAEAEADQRASQIAQERAGLERALLQAQGDTEALRALELAALAPSNRALQERIWALEEAAQAEAEADQRASQIAQERAGLERALLQAQGDTEALRALELAALAPSNRALQERIWALEEAAQAEAEAAQQASQIAQERAGLERALLQAQGDTEALRALELAALAPSNRALQERIWALQDEQAQAEAATAAQRQRLDIESVLLQALGATDELRRRELSTLDPANWALQQHIWALEDQQSAVEAARSALQRAAEAERERLDAAHREHMERIGEQSTAQQDALSEAESALSAIARTAQGMRLEGEQAEQMRRERARTTLYAMRDSGSVRPGDTLDRALSAASSISADQYGSYIEYLRDYAQTASLIGDLESLAGEQVSVEERTLQGIERRAEAAEQQHRAELARLDDTLAAAEQQYNALMGIDDSVLSVREAVDNLGATLAALADAREEAAASLEIPGFAAGGTHAGGLRIVGERGPELEFTGPSRIVSHRESRALLDFAGVIDELKALRKQVRKLEQYQYQTTKNTGQSAKYAKRWDAAGLLTREIVT